MMKKSTCILSIPTLCAMILLMAQGLFGEVRATFTATESCNVSPEVELVTGFLEFWLDDVEFEVTGLPDNEYYIVRPLGDDIHWHVSDEVFGNGAMATIFSEEALPEPDPDPEPDSEPEPDPGISPDALGPEDDVIKGMDAGRKELEETRDNRNDNHDTLYGPQMFNITFSGVGYYQVGYLENGVPRLSEPVAVPLNSRTRAPVVMRAGFFTIELVTPSGDPVEEPCSSGTGQNEFTFNGENTGVLSINLEASVNPAEAAYYLTGAVGFNVDPVGNAQPTYSGVSVNANGKLACTATITGLPIYNSDFGEKEAKVGFRDSIRDTKKYEVFFPRDARNHPGIGSGITPNWYYYWTQITGSADLAYGGASANFGYYDYDGTEGKLDKCIIYDSVIAFDNPTGPKGKAGIDCFGQTVCHERKHREQFYAGFSDTTGDNIPDYDITIDQDRDWLSDSYEDNHGFDKTKQDTDNNGVKDLEEESIAAESNWTNDSHNNQDWSKPGKNSGN